MTSAVTPLSTSAATTNFNLVSSPGKGRAGAAAGGSGGRASGGMKALSEDVSKWLVLGIESSCDDTAAAVVAGDGTVRAHRIASQVGCLASSSPHPLPASCAC